MRSAKHAVNGKPHPCERNLAAMCWLIDHFTRPGAIVVDPFCGSGTTGVAALRMGRSFIGIEREQQWADVAAEQLTAEENGSTYAAQRAGQLPMFPAT